MFIKGGWINRNKLLLNGADYLFNLILMGASPNKLINEIFVADNQTKLLKTIETAYKKAPFFSEVFPLMETILTYEDKNLAQFVGNSIIQIAKYLNFNTQFSYSSALKEKDNSLRAQAKVIHICSVLHATEYFNAIGGIELYDKADFEQNNIKLHFLKTKAIEYQQFRNQFVPNLSILDVMMFNAVGHINELLDTYELI
ncbi:hypothetical protein FACS1894199_09170 [Bacteroidia bacterium]|nr:hypothetical protein FACS1894199_09170 [Bacteroidia bacterium]